MKQHLRTVALCMAVSTIAMMAGQPVFAQASGAQTPEADAANGDQLGDIIVTARRSNENLQRVPVAVSVMSGESLEKQRITTARDLQYSVPSLTVARLRRSFSSEASSRRWDRTIPSSPI